MHHVSVAVNVNKNFVSNLGISKFSVMLRTICYASVVLVLAAFPLSIESQQNVAEHYLPPYDNPMITAERFKKILQESPITRWSATTRSSSKDTKEEPVKLNTTYTYRPEWPDPSRKLGTVSAVSFDKDGNVVVFHRVDRIWTGRTFNYANLYQEKSLGPITKNTIIAFDRKTGKVVYECGKNLFYMPHGLTVDHENNIWVTDVALHQVMKLSPKCSSDKPLLVLGTAFSPGIVKKFCKPTAVAVLPNGDFFISDGYCNSRILKLSKEGDIILTWGENSFQGDAHEVAPPNFFAIPHGLTLTKDAELLCVADRENGRVQCFHTSNGTFHSQYHSNTVGDRLFGVGYAPISGGQLFVVNGPENKNNHEVQGYIIDMSTKQVLSKFGPNGSQFSNPHDLAVSEDGSEIYVAELDPPRIHKFVHKNAALSDVNSTTSSPANVTSVVPQNSKSVVTKASLMSSSVLVIAALSLIVALIIMTIFVVVSKQRRRGNSDIALSSDVEYSKLMSKHACDDC